MPTDTDGMTPQAGKPVRKMPTGRRFTKGQSGNPGGKVRALLEIEAAIWSQEAGRVCEAVDKLYHLAFDDEGNPAFAALYFDRVLGKAKVKPLDRPIIGALPSSAAQLTSEVVALLAGEVRSLSEASKVRSLAPEEMGVLVSVVSILIKATTQEREHSQEDAAKMTTEELAREARAAADKVLGP